MIDNGVGIPPAMMKHMFELFHSTKGNRGTGLGLAVAKKIVDEHEGSITVKSSPGEGTTFTVRLPVYHERHRRPVADARAAVNARISIVFAASLRSRTACGCGGAEDNVAERSLCIASDAVKPYGSGVTAAASSATWRASFVVCFGRLP